MVILSDYSSLSNFLLLDDANDKTPRFVVMSFLPFCHMTIQSLIGVFVQTRKIDASRTCAL